MRLPKSVELAIPESITATVTPAPFGVSAGRPSVDRNEYVVSEEDVPVRATTASTEIDETEDAHASVVGGDARFRRVVLDGNAVHVDATQRGRVLWFQCLGEASYVWNKKDN